VLAVAVGVGIGTRPLWRVEPRAARDARQALAAGRYDEAGNELARWLRAAPDASEAHLLKGRAAVAMGRLPEAVDELKRAQALGHPRDGLALLRAIIAAKAGRHAEAEPTLKQAFDAGRTPDRQVDEALAKVYLQTYNLEGAAGVLDRWAREFPDDPKPHLWRAEVHSRTGGDAGAVERDYREALARDPSLVRARLGLADELRKAHRNAEAAAEYDAYFALEPGDAAAHLGAGQNLMEQGDEAAAARHLHRAIELDDKNAEAMKELAQAAVRHGEWAAALALLDRAIALDPTDLPLRHRRGLALARLGRAGEARAEQAAASRLRVELESLNEARKRLVASPHDRKSQLEVARWMFDHAQDKEGARWAEKILGEWPDDPEASRLLAGYHERRGEIGLANFYRLRAQTEPEPSAVRPASAPGETVPAKP
jgi:Flp pilus assembly protein TadD